MASRNILLTALVLGLGVQAVFLYDLDRKMAALENGLVAKTLDAHPELVQQALDKSREQVLEQRRSEASAWIAAHPGEIGTDPVTGKALLFDKSIVPAVLFVDYSCVSCTAALAKELNDIAAVDASVKITLREFSRRPMLGHQAAMLSVIDRRHSGKPTLAEAYMKSAGALDDKTAEALAKQTVPDLTVSDEDKKWANGVVDMNLSVAQTLALAPSSGGAVIGNKILSANASTDDLKQAINAARK